MNSSSATSVSESRPHYVKNLKVVIPIYKKDRMSIGIVDELYDVLERIVSEYSKTMYQLQVDSLKDFESELSEIRRITVQTGTQSGAIQPRHDVLRIATMEQALTGFMTSVQQAYRAAFED